MTVEASSELGMIVNDMWKELEYPIEQTYGMVIP
jgi:hypothetical protein